ncbi:MAG: hypothetical protein OXB88_01460 [Bacteriovoracales bacterium]|nr:hypothetical protein [Bacteriovoracales bacterium]
MQAHYLVTVKDPKNHLVSVTLNLKKDRERVEVFLPSWSPGSYLIREYARHIQNLRAEQQNGEILWCEQMDKGRFAIDFSKSDLNAPIQMGQDFSISYDVYCHEMTVRTSHIDESHAFLHGPSYLMGVAHAPLNSPTIEFRFPPLWSKLATGLEDISPKRNVFLYRAKNYDELLDSPVEIGCHESDGFATGGIPHHLNFYGPISSPLSTLKKDIKTIVETVSKTWGDIPYEQYVFITHSVPDLYGGLEHHNSTVLHFDGTQMNDREKYLGWLELVAHEYFHTWNVKRIRPVELGPFDYERENYTSMHWLTEGLTSFMDGLLVLRSGLMSLEEYLKKLAREIDALAQTPGRKFHSLEQSSFNAWIKLYRPDENTQNSSVSYYLKGGLVFFALQCMLAQKKRDMVDLLHLLWKRYKKDPDRGVLAHEVYEMIESLGGPTIRESFETFVSTTREIDFEAHLASIGLEVVRDEEVTPTLGARVKFNGDRVLIDRVILDGPAYRAGLNGGDEILFVGGVRFLRKQWERLSKTARVGEATSILLSRLGRPVEAQVIFEQGPQKIKEILCRDRAKALKILKGN